MPEYQIDEMIYAYTEGNIGLEDIVLYEKDIDDFYLWLAFKNLDSAKERWIMKNHKST